MLPMSVQYQRNQLLGMCSLGMWTAIHIKFNCLMCRSSSTHNIWLLTMHHAGVHGKLNMSCTGAHGEVYSQLALLLMNDKPGITANYSRAVCTNNVFFGNPAAASGTESYNWLFDDFQKSYIQFVFSSMHLCIYVYTHLYSYPSTLGISELAAYCGLEQFEMWLKVTIMLTQRFIWMPWLSQIWDELEGHNCIVLEVVIERDWRYTWDAMTMWTWWP